MEHQAKFFAETYEKQVEIRLKKPGGITFTIVIKVPVGGALLVREKPRGEA